MRVKEKAVFIIITVLAMVLGGCSDSTDGLESSVSVTYVDHEQMSAGQVYVAENITAVTTTFSLTIDNSGSGPLHVWKIYDITDPAEAAYHNGAFDISYEDLTTSFDVAADGSYPFTVTLNLDPGTTGSFKIKVGIMHDNGIYPNPYTFTIYAKDVNVPGI